MSRLVNALILVAVIALAPLVPLASAHPSIGLTTDVNHVILNPGEATNITLTIHNNGSSIETYSINVSGYDSVWEIIPSESTVSNVIPTYSDSTTIAVRLSTSALPSNSGILTITVTEPDANVSSQIEVLLSVQPRHLPSISAQTAGDNGLVEMDPGTEVNLSISVRNDGNVNDTILLSVGQTPDLAGFWANWTSGGNNNSENTSETNNTDMGNSTGGGNNTSGNNTGSGNSTNDGNNSSTNNTGGNSTEGGTNNTGGTTQEVIRLTIPAVQHPAPKLNQVITEKLGSWMIQWTVWYLVNQELQPSEYRYHLTKDPGTMDSNYLQQVLLGITL